MQSEVMSDLFTQYGDKVFCYILGRVHHYADAEDLRNDVFVKVMANIGQYDSHRASYSTWIYSITRNVVNDYFRSHTKAAANLSLLPADTGTADLMDWDLPLLTEALLQCTQRERDIIILHFYHGYPYAKIADILHLSSANVRVISCRTSKKLREMLQNIEQGKFPPRTER